MLQGTKDRNQLIISPGVESQRNNLRQRRGGRRGQRRGRGGVPAEGTRGARLEPLVDALRVEAVAALRNAPYGLLGKILAQANRARALVAGPGQAFALSDHDLGPVAGLDGGLLHAQDHNARPIRGVTKTTIVIIIIIVVDAVVVTVASDDDDVGFDSDAGVGGEHDGGDEDQDAHGDGNAVAESLGGGDGGGWRSRREHEKEKERVWLVRNLELDCVIRTAFRGKKLNACLKRL